MPAIDQNAILARILMQTACFIYLLTKKTLRTKISRIRLVASLASCKPALTYAKTSRIATFMSMPKFGQHSTSTAKHSTARQVFYGWINSRSPENEHCKMGSLSPPPSRPRFSPRRHYPRSYRIHEK